MASPRHHSHMGEALDIKQRVVCVADGGRPSFNSSELKYTKNLLRP